MQNKLYDSLDADSTPAKVASKMFGFRARKQKSGKTFYYFDSGHRSRPEVPLGSDLEMALERYKWLASDASSYKAQEKSFFLYRHYDQAGILLYVGVALSPIQRLSKHREHSPWFWSIARIEITRFASRSESEAAEKFAILQENPLFNLQHLRKDRLSGAKSLRGKLKPQGPFAPPLTHTPEA